MNKNLLLLLSVLLLAFFNNVLSQTLNYSKLDSMLNLEYSFQIKNLNKKGFKHIVYKDSVISKSLTTEEKFTFIYDKGELIEVVFDNFYFDDVKYLFVEDRYYLCLDENVWGVIKLNQKKFKLCLGL